MSDVGFAKQYFTLINKTKKIKKRDVHFFFAYYLEQRENKQAIYKMLKSEFKLSSLDRDTEVKYEGHNSNKKDKSSVMIVNLFQESTILKINKIEEIYKEVIRSEESINTYDNIHNYLYEYINIEGIIYLDELKNNIYKMKEIEYEYLKDRGIEYSTCIDLFNELCELLEYRDVVDNFNEFKLIIRYSKLTPYLYCIDELKKDTLNDIFEIAKGYYNFKDLNEFIKVYFGQVYDNFNIRVTSIKGFLENNEQDIKYNKESDNSGGSLILVDIIHYMLYFPLFIVYFIFKVFMYIFTKLGTLSLLSVVIVGFICGVLYPKVMEMDNIINFYNQINFGTVYTYMQEDINTPHKSIILSIILGFGTLIFLAAVYIGPVLIVRSFINGSIGEINESFDWVGIKRTFKKIFADIKQKTKDQYRTKKATFFVEKLIKIIMNIVSTIIVVILMSFIPQIIDDIKIKFTQWVQDNSSQEILENSNNDLEEENKVGVGTNIKIIVENANVRSEANMEAGIIKVAKLGELYLYTGNKEIDKENKVWYEVYVDNLNINKGWISQKVSTIEEN